MNTTFALTVFGMVLAVYCVLLWAYWALVFPVVRKSLQFRIENDHDMARLLMLKGELAPGCKIATRVDEFLRSSLRATDADSWISLKPVPDSDIKEREFALKALLAEMDDHHRDLRGIVERTMNALFILYLLQRPIFVGGIACLAVLSLFMQRRKADLEEREVRGAASALAAA